MTLISSSKFEFLESKVALDDQSMFTLHWASLQPFIYKNYI